jgi:hypothetical protein
MSAESLSLVAGTLLSLIFSYVPGIHNSYSNLESTIKRLIMLGLLLVVSGSIYGLSCLGWAQEWGMAITCNQSGLMALIRQTLIAIIANQSVYAISPQNKNSNDHVESKPTEPNFSYLVEEANDIKE